MQELRDGLCVDDLMTCGVTVKETEEKKAIATALFEDATFSIHKWHSNGIQLESAGESSPDYEVTYAKQQLGGSEQLGGKFLCLPWNREQDNISVILNVEDCTTKGVVLSQLAKDYDPFGFVSPTTLVTKLLYSDICDTKIYHGMQDYLIQFLRGCLSKNRLLISGSKNSFPSYFYHELHFSQ